MVEWTHSAGPAQITPYSRGGAAVPRRAHPNGANDNLACVAECKALYLTLRIGQPQDVSDLNINKTQSLRVAGNVPHHIKNLGGFNTAANYLAPNRQADLNYI